MYNDDRIAGIVDFHALLTGEPDAFAPDGYGPVTSDIDLATAVGMSSRFPWIAPAASVTVNLDKTVWLNAAGSEKNEKIGSQTIRLVDGGYYDNIRNGHAFGSSRQSKIYGSEV